MLLLHRWRVLLLCLASACRSGGGESPVEPVLGQDAMTDVHTIASARSRVTPRHGAVARERAAAADALVRDGRFGAAVKAYGEAFVHDPLPEYLVAFAAAHARTPREPGGAPAIEDAERKANEAAARMLHVAEQITENQDLLSRTARLRQCLSSAANRSDAGRCVARSGVEP